ncbi:hypothetical protein AVEN_164383-2 [Araneus ventricosus]|uniref:C2H2-type domain-containing protein n=1 Tax=Araneus ventricosus TaxID=182803 RepID=A0A4Y2GEV4_ARAVE|nr:hypothetical protein AVEN_164383-2 [Araneus ventricosus]
MYLTAEIGDDYCAQVNMQEIDDGESRALYETQIIEGHTVHCCMVCQYRSIIITNMKHHVRTHTGERPFSYPHCGKRNRRQRYPSGKVLAFKQEGPGSKPDSTEDPQCMRPVAR